MPCSSVYCISGAGIYDGNYGVGPTTFNGYDYFTGDTSPTYYIYYNSGSTTPSWCLSTALDGTCLLFGKSPCLSSCPDLCDDFFSSGACPTPTPTPTAACDIDFDAYFDCNVTPTPTPTPSVTQTPTPTPTPTSTNPCGGISLTVSAITITPTPSPTPSLTPTQTPEIIRPCNYTGKVTFNTIDDFLRCSTSKKFRDCVSGFLFYSSDVILDEYGFVPSLGVVYRAIINETSVCVVYDGQVDNISGADDITLLETIGPESNGSCLNCFQMPTPTPTPTSTTTPTPTPTFTPTPTPTSTTPLTPADYFVGCGGGFCIYDQIDFGPSDNPSDLFSSWNRFALFAPNVYPGTTILTGLMPDGSIITNNPSYYFYTGSSNYLGSFNLVMTEGQNIGPSPSNSSNANKFYYNTHINKMVVSYDVGGSALYQWATFNPTEDVGATLGNPTATQELTTSTNWGLENLTTSQYTVSGSSNIVVLAQQKILDAGGSPKMIQCSLNSGLFNGFYSVCEYGDYVHEVTLGSTDFDDDQIGIVLATKKGLGTNPNSTDMLSLVFNGFRNSVNVVYNAGQDVYAFNNNLGLASGAIMTGATNPFGSGNYYNKGQVRIKIIKTSTIISIYTTQRMGLYGVPPGNSNPYTLLYEFDLTDKNTWNAEPSYAIGNELLKFTGTTRFGYLTASQPSTQFYDIEFSSIQQPSNILYSKTVSNPILNKVYSFIGVDGCWTYSGSTFNYSDLDLVNLTTQTVNDSCTDC